MTPTQDSANTRRLKVRIDGDVGTFFARVARDQHVARDGRTPRPSTSCRCRWAARRTTTASSARSATPAAGHGRHHRTPSTTLTTSWFSAANTKGTNAWTTPGNVYTSNDTRSTSATANQYQQWGDFGITLAGTVTNIDGIEVRAEMSRSGTGNQTNCQVQFELSYNNGTNFTTGSRHRREALDRAPPARRARPYQSLGNGTDKWNRGSWATSELTNGNFRVRVRTIKPSTAVCAATRSCTRSTTCRSASGTTTRRPTSTFYPDTNSPARTAATLTPRGFWGVMLTQGAENINGDAYMPFYDTRTSATQPGLLRHELLRLRGRDARPASNAGEVWIFDPGMCAVASDMGTGDRYFGNTNTQRVERGQRVLHAVRHEEHAVRHQRRRRAAVASSGTFFANMAGSDQTMNGPSGANLDDCSDAAIGSNTSSPSTTTTGGGSSRAA